MIKRALSMIAALAISACVPEPFAERPAAEEITSDGATVYTFTLTRANVLEVKPVSKSAIQDRGRSLCPGGFSEVSRYGETTRRGSGVIYTDVTVRIVCR